MQAPCHFLAVENDPNEAFFLARAFEKLANLASVHVCRNVAEAKAYLEGAGMYGDRTVYPLPQVILSDLNMPMENGLDLLDWVRGNGDVNHIPLMILSGSSSAVEMEKAKTAGAAQFIEKPADYQSLLDMLERLARSFCRRTEAED